MMRLIYIAFLLSLVGCHNGTTVTRDRAWRRIERADGTVIVEELWDIRWATPAQSPAP
jgi:hypothetical protein